MSTPASEPQASIHLEDVFMMGISPTPGPDPRFVATLPSGTEVTFSREATAAEVAAYLQSEGIRIPSALEARRS